MAKRSPIDAALVTLEGDVVLYAGRVVGQILNIGRTYNDGRERIYGSMNTDEIYYSERAAAIAEARKWNGE